MTSIATLGPEGSHAWQAARRYRPDAEIKLFAHLNAVAEAFRQRAADLALIPVYNTREGEIKEYFRVMEKLSGSSWIDNVVLPVQLSLGGLDADTPLAMVTGTSQMLRQCGDYLITRLADTPQLAVPTLEEAITAVKTGGLADRGVIGPEEVLVRHGLVIREREVSPHNRTRFAVLGREPAPATGYDATAMITAPLKDRVGLLYDALGEFSKRGINLLDLRSETDITSQKLQFYIEAEGHSEDPNLREAVERIERHVIQEPHSIRVLGSFPRVDMRPKRINTLGFIGTGEMSAWFARHLENEGYRTLLTGRNSSPTPEEMLPRVEVVLICVPISATSSTIERYGPMLRDGQALVLLAGEAENTINTALAHTSEGVELMLVHNLWGPKAATMKDKNVSLVRTRRSGALCSEIEAFLYKHGAVISQDSPTMHDRLMGVSQKLPTVISVAMAMTLKANDIAPDDIGPHSTLTSLYGILAMCRAHSQNPRTYAEIMATKGDGRTITRSFAANLVTVLDLADSGRIDELCTLIEANRGYLTEEFLRTRMEQSLAVDETLGQLVRP